MDTSVNLAMSSMRIESDEKPLILSNDPKYKSSIRNSRSLIGRLLNPEAQSVSNAIFDLPRKWGVADRVRGIALSRDRFQFFFQLEEDLQRVLKIGVWTHEDWCIIIERWVEFPPPTYLMFLPVWIRLRNLPINFYTSYTINDLAEEVGEVKELALDELHSQSKDYVRAKVLFDVSHPVRRTKVLQLPHGENVIINYEFERIRKRCFNCQRLTHDKTKCPFDPLIRPPQATVEETIISSVPVQPELIMEGDPLFGVVTNDQVKIDLKSGKPMIASEVLNDMRQYLSVEDYTERKAREIRVKQSLKDLQNDSEGQKKFLRLEPSPLISQNVNKDKGIVFDFTTQDYDQIMVAEKLMADSIKANIHQPGSESSATAKSSTRRRPSKHQRQKQSPNINISLESPDKMMQDSDNLAMKRKAQADLKTSENKGKRTQSDAAPAEESPKLL